MNPSCPPRRSSGSSQAPNDRRRGQLCTGFTPAEFHYQSRFGVQTSGASSVCSGARRSRLPSSGHTRYARGAPAALKYKGSLQVPVHGIAHYNFRLERALLESVRDFYIATVGLEVGKRPPFKSFGFWLYAGNQDLLHLSEELEGDRRRKGSDLTFDHVAFECTGLAIYRNRLRKLCIPFTEEAVPQTGRRQLFFRDPVGNGVELIFPPSEA